MSVDCGWVIAGTSNHKLYFMAWASLPSCAYHLFTQKLYYMK